MNDITITVQIADRNYRLTVKQDEEETVRKAVKEVNQYLKKYTEMYTFNDYQDLLAMVTLEISVQTVTKQQQVMQDEQELLDKIGALEKLIEPYI